MSKADIEAWTAQAGTCETCNEAPPHSSWRWNGEEWEHKCRAKDPQVGHLRAKRKEETPRADAPDLGIPTTPKEVAAFERYMAEELEDLDGYDCPECRDTGVNGGGEDCRCTASAGKFRAGVFGFR